LNEWLPVPQLPATIGENNVRPETSDGNTEQRLEQDMQGIRSRIGPRSEDKREPGDYRRPANEDKGETLYSRARPSVVQPCDNVDTGKVDLEGISSGPNRINIKWRWRWLDRLI
jgi:hypothetical protein